MYSINNGMLLVFVENGLIDSFGGELGIDPALCFFTHLFPHMVIIKYVAQGFG